MADLPIRKSMDSRRPAEEKFPVWAPDGHMEMHTRQNINDLVRHGTLVDNVLTPWSLQDPNLAQSRREAIAAAVARDAAAGVPPGQQGKQGVSASASAPPSPTPPAAPKLAELRAKLTDLGGVPDPTWGTKRLESEIQLFQARVSKPDQMQTPAA